MDSSIADGEWRGEKEGGSVEVRAEETFHFREHLQTILFAAKGFDYSSQYSIWQRQVDDALDIFAACQS